MSRDMPALIAAFIETWLPQSGDSIGMTESEFRDDFQPENFGEDLADLLTMAHASGLAGTPLPTVPSTTIEVLG